MLIQRKWQISDDKLSKKTNKQQNQSHTKQNQKKKNKTPRNIALHKGFDKQHATM